MELLLDTQIVLWASLTTRKLPASARVLLEDEANTLLFSVASIWETAVKRSLGRSDFQAEPGVLRRVLLRSGYQELQITGDHAIAVAALPPIHKDPFDRILLAKAMVEGMTFVTADSILKQYPALVQLV